MLTSSAKAKGRRLCAKVKEILHEWAPDLQDKDIRVTPSGVNGPDLQFSPRAEEVYPLAFECKNQEKLNVWKSLEQAESHHEEGTYPILAFSRNRSKVYVAMEIEHFLRLIR